MYCITKTLQTTGGFRLYRHQACFRDMRLEHDIVLTKRFPRTQASSLDLVKVILNNVQQAVH